MYETTLVFSKEVAQPTCDKLLILCSEPTFKRWKKSFHRGKEFLSRENPFIITELLVSYFCKKQKNKIVFILSSDIYMIIRNCKQHFHSWLLWKVSFKNFTNRLDINATWIMLQPTLTHFVKMIDYTYEFK